MPKRVDKNQREIVDGLRAMGASVQCLHTIGRGCPDILVGWRGVNLLAEIKSGAGTLTDDEKTWHASWRGQVCVIRSVEDVTKLLGAA